MGFFDSALSSLSSGIKDSLDEAKKKAEAIVDSVEVPAALSDLSDRAANLASEYFEAGKQHADRIASNVQDNLKAIDYDTLLSGDTYVNKFNEYTEIGTERVTALYKATFEVDKTTAEIVDSIRSQLPSSVESVDHIFEQVKQECLQRAVSAFCLAPIMSSLDDKLESRYSNLSVKYGDFNRNNNLHDDQNFANLKNTRTEAEYVQPIKNGYNGSKALSRAETHIDHIVSKKEYYEDALIRLATDDDAFIAAINAEDNLTFADGYFNCGKSSGDLMKYIKERGTPDEFDPNLIHFNYKEGGRVTINKAEALAKYEKAQEQLGKARIEAAKEIGLTVASAGARMAAQQVVGLIVVETVDIFVGEIKDIALNGKLFDENGLIANINQRRNNIASRLAERFDERQVWERARAAGIEGGVLGALAAIPQILISIILRMPAFMLSIIRECTLSVVRSIRVMLSDDDNKLDSIRIILFGAVSGILGVYVANVISKAISPVPMLNIFNSQVTDVLSGAVVTAAPMAAIYLFDKSKADFALTVLGSPPSPGS